MSRLLVLVAGFALLQSASSLAVQAQVSPTALLRSEIQQAVRAYVDANNNADATSLVEMYTRQPGVTSVGDGEITRGWDRIREHFDQLIGFEGSFKIRIGSIDVTPLGPGYALALSSYVLTMNLQGVDVQQRGAMTLVFQQFDGEWKIIHDHFSTQPTSDQSPGGQQARGVAAPARQPLTIPIGDGRQVAIEAGKYVQYEFNVPDGVCVVTGRIDLLAGGNKDFEAFVMDSENLRAWRSGLEARTYWQTGRVASALIDAVALVGPGTYYLVVSNVFSLLTPKTVTVKAEAEC